MSPFRSRSRPTRASAQRRSCSPATRTYPRRSKTSARSSPTRRCSATSRSGSTTCCASSTPATPAGSRRRTVPVERESDGVYRFVPAGGKEPRILLDAKSLEFRPDGVYYRYSAASEPVRLRFDEYDYETDDLKTRSFERDGRRVEFTDVAQLRERDGRLWYDYWELTGSKMWITNARMAGVFGLYAKTEEGVTGFVVDRHAQGLKDGKDEAKMGQLGSPTNELAVQAARAPR